ncbi:MAG: hypothetical protein ACJ8EK_16510 [Bradyrhizobium sp.]|jgi:hypothetical protein
MFLQMGLDRANQIESFQQMTLRAPPKILEISTVMWGLSSGWRAIAARRADQLGLSQPLSSGMRSYG